MDHPNSDLLRRAWAAYDRGDEEGFAACLTEDWREYDSAGNDATLDDERETMRQHRIAFPDKHTEILRIVADDEFVACHGRTSATHTGQYLDLAPTGRTVHVEEMMFNRIREGKLCETWALVEGKGFYEQLTGRQPPRGLDNLA